MMVLRSTEPHNITLKNLALFRPNVCDSLSANQIPKFMNYYCYVLNVIEFSIRLKSLNHSRGIEIRSRDSIIVLLKIAENKANFFTVSL